MLSMVFAMLTISLSSARRIAEVIEEKTDIQNPEHPIMAVRVGAIDFDHVSFVYASKADKKVLDDIDLHIRSGETIGVIGGTGARPSLARAAHPASVRCHRRQADARRRGRARL